MSLTDDDTELEQLVGTTLASKYRLDRVIGRGGMGAVFQATHLGINKRVAIKFLLKDAARDRDAVTRFQREALAASAVESAHIVEIFDSGLNEQGHPFLVMELLRGEDLRARLKREGRLSPKVATQITCQILRGLVRAHDAGIVHRDLKPDNVFLCDRDDDPMFVKIVDFGISKLANETTLDTLTRRGTVLGTAFYMSPEQAQGFPDVDGRTDLFSIGAILYEMLAGRPPHVGNTYEAVLVAICTRDPEDVRTLAPEVSEALFHVIARAIARERSERFASATEFYQALSAAVPDTVRPPLFASAATTNESVSVQGSSAPRGEGDAQHASFATAGGTSLQSRSTDRKREKRRLAVTGLVLGLGGFTAAILLLSRTRAPEPSHVLAEPSGASSSVSSQAVPASTSPSAVPIAAPVRTAPVQAPAPLAPSSEAPQTKARSGAQPPPKPSGAVPRTTTRTAPQVTASETGKARPLGLKLGGP